MIAMAIIRAVMNRLKSCQRCGSYEKYFAEKAGDEMAIMINLGRYPYYFLFLRPKKIRQ
jgi:hypothetical protein